METSTVDSCVFPQQEQTLNSYSSTLNTDCSYSMNMNQVSPMIQVTRIKLEPCFTVILTEDQMTRNFYENKSPEILQKKQSIELDKEQASNTSTNFENQYSFQWIKKGEKLNNTISMNKYSTKQSTPFLPLKPILKKLRKEEVSKLTTLQTCIPRSSSCPLSSTVTKETSSIRLDFDKIRCVADITAKQSSSSPIFRSLFHQTINIFNPNESYEIYSSNYYPFRCQYYMKPYREAANPQKNSKKKGSRSFSRSYPFEDVSRKNIESYTLSDHCNRPLKQRSNKKRHISWSPIREYIPDGRPKSIKKTIKGNDKSSITISPSLSSSEHNLQKSSLPTTTICVPDKIIISNQLSAVQLPVDSYHPSSENEHLTTSVDPTFHEGYNRKEKKIALKSYISEPVYRDQKEHYERMEHYDRLLKKMRATDEQLRLLSRSWANNEQQKTLVTTDQTSKSSINKIKINRPNFSPIILQMCFFGLIILNLFIFYFFNEINVWWSGYTGSAVMIEQHAEDTLNF